MARISLQEVERIAISILVILGGVTSHCYTKAWWEGRYRFNRYGRGATRAYANLLHSLSQSIQAGPCEKSVLCQIWDIERTGCKCHVRRICTRGYRERASARYTNVRQKELKK